jgi:hypothetical protein
MTSNSESEFIPDELLSGYLDNELSDAERVRVESTLESSEPHRQVLAELRALREGLSALPRHNVDASFQQRILDRIANAPNREPAATSDNDTTQVASAATSALVDHDSFRRNVMAFAAIAAGLLIAFVSFHKAGFFSVAKNDPRGSSNGRAKGVDSFQGIAEAQPDQEVQLQSQVAENQASKVSTEAVSAERLSMDQPAPALTGSLADDSAALDSMGAPGDSVTGDSVTGDSVTGDSVTGGGVQELPTAPASIGAEPVSYAPKKLAEIVHAVRQDLVDVVVEVRTNDVDSVIAMLPANTRTATQVDGQPLAFKQFRETEELGEVAQLRIVESMDAEQIRTVAQRIRATGKTVHVFDSPTVLATLAQPAVGNRYSQYYAYAVRDAEQDESVAQFYRAADSEPKQYDLFIDLDADSPEDDEEASIEVSPMKFKDDQIAASTLDKSRSMRRSIGNSRSDAGNPALRVLFLFIPE